MQERTEAINKLVDFDNGITSMTCGGRMDPGYELTMTHILPFPWNIYESKLIPFERGCVLRSQNWLRNENLLVKLLFLNPIASIKLFAAGKGELGTFLHFLSTYYCSQLVFEF